MLCKKVTIVPLEVIVRNTAAGSMAKRLGLAEGTELKTTVFELSYKDDSLGDPLINGYHAVAIGASTFEEIEAIRKITFKVNEVLKAFFLQRGIRLIDFKLEFGKTSDTGKLVLADEISPDTCRFWDAKTGEKLDKDRFRRDMGNVKEAYVEILKRLNG
jgi:phosphoribosylaminoimidazole-succinocarboxamide synthase